MDLLADTEEILSDEYEEGEILDDDDLYDEVSSLEEFSFADIDELNLIRPKHDHCGLVVTEKKPKQITKQHRKKEHKCKEDSLCRKERIGKHCYTRIKKEKPKPEVTFQVSSSDKIVPKRLDVYNVAKYGSRLNRAPSPNRQMPEPLLKPLRRNDVKDPIKLINQLLKENRSTNKKSWDNSDRSVYRNERKYPIRHQPYHKNRGKNYDDYNYDNKERHPNLHPTPRYHQKEYDTVDKTETPSKTSLLKRLVGSGASGVKPIKENEYLSENTNLPSASSLCDKPDRYNEVPTVLDTKKIVVEENGSRNKAVSSTDIPCVDALEPHAETVPKKIEVKWMRSFKEDKDELHLRVEALRSAWVKKFHDRKKRGLIQQKRIGEVDDSLVDFVLDSDSDEFNVFSENLSAVKEPSIGIENDNNSQYNIAQQSGDIIKTEDMVISFCEKTDDTIICESPITIVDGAQCPNNLFSKDDPLFITSSFLISQMGDDLIPLKHLETDKSNKWSITTGPVEFYNMTNNSNSSTIEPLKNASESKMALNHSISDQGQGIIVIDDDDSKMVNDLDVKADSKLKISITPELVTLKKQAKSARKRKRKKILKQKKKDEFEENLLRELALKSVKSKKSLQSSSQVKTVNVSDKSTPNSTSTISTNEVIIKKPSNKSMTNWEDDLDEDILRAQLLSSLTKHVSSYDDCAQPSDVNRSISVPETGMQLNRSLKKSCSVRKSLEKKKRRSIDRKKVLINKKIWKPINPRDKKVGLDHNKIPIYGLGNVYLKDIKPQLKVKNQRCNVPVVQKMVIQINDSDSSEDDLVILDESNSPQKNNVPCNTVPADIEANIDLLLKQAEMEKVASDPTLKSSQAKDDLYQVQTDTIEKMSDLCDKTPEIVLSLQAEDTKSPKSVVLSSNSSSSSAQSVATPQALKHLPAWQQEEYKRLKKKIAEKEKVLQVTRLKIVDAPKDIATGSGKSVVSSKGTAILSFDSIAPLKEVSVSTSTNMEFPIDFLVTSSKNNEGPTEVIMLNTKTITVSKEVPVSCSSKSVDCVLSNLESTQRNGSQGSANTSTFDASSREASGSSATVQKITTSKTNVIDGQSKEISVKLTNEINKNEKAQEKLLTDDNVNKKGFTDITSCSIMEEINHVSDIVHEFEKNMSECSNLRNKFNRLQKLMKITESKIGLKKKNLLNIKDTITEKERIISSKIASITLTKSPLNEKNRAPNRDFELIKLKHKEISLKAQFLFHDLVNDKMQMDDNIQNKMNRMVTSSSVDKSTVCEDKKRSLIRSGNDPDTNKGPTQSGPNLSTVEKGKDIIEPLKKRHFSGKERERGEWDPNTPVCHFDLNGICKDEECKYQHFKTV